MSLSVISHPLIQHKLSIMRDRHTKSKDFRQLLKEISVYLTYEALKDAPLHLEDVETPITKMKAPKVNESEIVVVSILRAGNGILEGALEAIPAARAGHIGIYRDPKTHLPVEYYCKLPESTRHSDVIIVDPMLATGNSAVAAVKKIKEIGCRSLKFIALLAAPEGIKTLSTAFPDLPIILAAVDEQLNEHAYIVPGLGDAGDRIYGTR